MQFLNGEYGVKNIYAELPVIIGSKGVEKIIEIKLSSDERKNFEKSIDAVKDLFDAATKIDPILKINIFYKSLKYIFQNYNY